MKFSKFVYFSFALLILMLQCKNDAAKMDPNSIDNKIIVLMADRADKSETLKDKILNKRSLLKRSCKTLLGGKLESS